MAYQKMQRWPGVTKQLLAETSERGYKTILEDLKDYYSPITSDRGLTLVIDGNASNPKGRKTWRHEIKKDDTLCAIVNVQHLETGLDDRPPPGSATQKYGIYFNALKDGKINNGLSLQERNGFYEYFKNR